MWLYVDGVVQGTPGVKFFGQAPSTGNALPLARSLEAQGSFEGTLDELRVWNYARTQAQIVAAKDAETVAQAGLVAYWRANEGTGSVLGDVSGSGATAQIRNVYGAGSGVVAGRIDHPGQ